MAKRRTYKCDRRGRFASTDSTRVKRIRRKINRRRPRYVRGSLGKTLRVGRGHPTLAAADTPLHTAHRRAVFPELVARRMRALEYDIRAAALGPITNPDYDR